jgi:hypothetical protein
MPIKLDINEYGHFIITDGVDTQLVYPKTFKQLITIIDQLNVQKISKSVYEAPHHSTDWRVLAMSSQLITLNEILASQKLEDQDPNLIN